MRTAGLAPNFCQLPRDAVSCTSLPGADERGPEDVLLALPGPLPGALPGALPGGGLNRGVRHDPHSGLANGQIPVLVFFFSEVFFSFFFPVFFSPPPFSFLFFFYLVDSMP